jgi:hypothetical protein
LEQIIEVPQEVDALAEFRAQVAAEKAEPRGRMTDAAVAKFRAIKEQERLDSIAAERFRNALLSIVPSPENLKKLVVNTRLSTPRLRYADRMIRTDDIADRMSLKLAWWIAAGYKLGREIDSVAMLNFFSELTLDEVSMSDKQFAAVWDAASAKKRLQSRLSREIIKAADPEPEKPTKPAKVRLCKSGAKCVWVKYRKPAAAVGRSFYCTPACQKCDLARQRRSVPTPSASETSGCSLGAP